EQRRAKEESTEQEGKGELHIAWLSTVGTRKIVGPLLPFRRGPGDNRLPTFAKWRTRSVGRRCRRQLLQVGMPVIKYWLSVRVRSRLLRVGFAEGVADDRVVSSR